MVAEFKIPSPKDIRKLRRKIGLTQSELATRVGISQSVIARIERGQINPSVDTLRKILTIIEEEQQIHYRIRDLLQWKRKTTKLPVLIWLKPEDKVRRAVILMKKHGISQIPVIKGNVVLGSVYEHTIIRHLVTDGSNVVFTKSIQEIMEAPFPTISVEYSIDDAFTMMASGIEAVLVVEKNRPVGVITKIDVISFMKK